MQHRQCRVAQASIEQVPVSVRFGDLVIVDHPGNDTPDWELILHVETPMDLERRGYHLEMTTTDAERICGFAVLVRSVEATMVFRGAGPLTG